MTDYPRLTEMGVLHPQQIADFSINALEQTDYLRIVYDRPKGSLLATSRSYKFPREQKEVESGDDSATTQYVMQSSTEFREAVAELRVLLGGKEDKKELATTMLDQLHQLEEEFGMHTEALKALIEKVRAI
jgi:hypothetical protein